MNDDGMRKKEKVIWLDEEMGGMVGLYVATKKMCGVYLRSDTFKLFLSFTILYFSFPKGVTWFFTR